jgi:hypothetical protein
LKIRWKEPIFQAPGQHFIPIDNKFLDPEGVGIDHCALQYADGEEARQASKSISSASQVTLT